MGRSGSMFAWQQFGVKPDVMTCAKALGCGVPVGAFLVGEKASVLVAGDHGSTYGGNPFVGAAISKVFDLFEEMNLLSYVKETSAYLEEKLDELVEKYDFIKERRGIGFMQGVEFDMPVKDIIGTAMDNGLILISAGANTIRFLPPLIVKKEHIDEMISILEKTF